MKNKFIKTTLIDAFFYFSVYIYVSFLSPYLNTLGWSEFLKGWFFSVFAITGILVAPVIGTISDKVGRFHMLIFGFSLEMLSLIGYIFITNPVLLFVLRIFSAIAFNTVVITSFSRINDTVDNANRTKRTGLFQSILSVATMLSPLIGGVVADAYGYKAVFLFSLIVALFFLTAILVEDHFYFKEHSPYRKKPKLKARDSNPFADIWDVLKIKAFRNLSILGVTANFTTPITIMVLPYIIVERMGLSNTDISIALFVLGTAHIMQFLLGGFAKYFGKGKSIVLGFIIFIVAMSSMFFAKTFGILLVLLFIKGIGGGLWSVSLWSYLSDIGERNGLEGKIVGSYSSLTRISQAISFIVAGLILSIWQEGIFLFFGLVVLIPLLFLGRYVIKHDSSTS